jgi:predicted CoA-substrate-specific enzyme activase
LWLQGEIMLDMDEISFGGLEIGSVSVKWVCGAKNGKITATIVRHEGNPKEKIQEILDQHEFHKGKSLVVTGQPISGRGNIRYRPELECLEKGLEYYDLKPDILLSLGGETFTVYPMRDGRIKNIIASSKCAAGTGEFLVQQLGRMGYSLEQGIDAYREGKQIKLATRCSVHCKSDATHKLNKGECTRSDIVRSLIDSLAEKVCAMIEHSKWPMRTIVVSGGVAQNRAFLASLSQLMTGSEIIVKEESPYLGAFGAYLFASESSELSEQKENSDRAETVSLDTLAPLSKFEHLLDFRVKADDALSIKRGASYILAVDAGSTTTKATLLNASDGTLGARCYLRTMGNPITATRACLQELIKQTKDARLRIIQAVVTGSAREMVSVYLNNCLSVNEILAHARAAREEIEEVDTVFEIGGQDSKFIAFLSGVPVDYAMNEGCSAGTGSFLEESISSDMGIQYQEISGLAMKSAQPIRFGERCAAFINTDLRSALQQGAKTEDVIAGLVYSIADNYVTRIVGSRALGDTVLFQGGVALNKSAACALAAAIQRKIIVPRHPELMGCVGAALMARDLITQGHSTEKEYRLEDLVTGSVEVQGEFQCEACRNRCDIQKIAVGKSVYPFGGLCSKFENIRHGHSQPTDAIDYVEMRNHLMFEEFGPVNLPSPRGRIGLPMALTTFELFPFYTKLINEMGYELVLSEPSKTGNSKTLAPMCYPCEIVHGAVYDLIHKKVDHIFLPYLLEFDIPLSYRHAFTCPSTANLPDIIQAAFGQEFNGFITPHIGLSAHLINTTRKEIISMGRQLGVKRSVAEKAFAKALEHYASFCTKRNAIGATIATRMPSQPCIILAGRPYITCSNEVNFSLPRKMTSRGYNVIAADMLPWLNDNTYPGDVWYFAAQVMNAIEYVKKYPSMNLCLFSCFSCIPDASMYHLVRKEIAGNVFCYLEIDSHTAHAGIETRVGAFLDIIEEKLRQKIRAGPHAKPANRDGTYIDREAIHA